MVKSYASEYGSKNVKNEEKDLKINSLNVNYLNKPTNNFYIIGPGDKININVSRDYHLFPIGVDSKKRDKLISFLNKNKIQVTVNYRSITELTYYKKKYRYKCKVSENWGRQTLSIPFHLKISNKDINYIYSKLNSFFKR